MNQYTEYFKQAELALTVYAKNLLPGDPIESELMKADFSASQVRAFANTYRVVDQFNDSATGLSVTVFVDKDSRETIPIVGLGFDVAPPNSIVAEDPMNVAIRSPSYASNQKHKVLTDTLVVELVWGDFTRRAQAILHQKIY